MKNLFVGAGLVLALVSVGHIWAQEAQLTVNADEEGVVERVEHEVKQNVGDDTHSGLKIDLSFKDDEIDDEESIEKLTAVVRKLAGDEVANEVVIELNGLSESEKAEVAEAIRDGLSFKSDDIPGWVGVVAIVAVVLFFSVLVILPIAFFIYGSRKRRQKMNLIQVYLDSGRDVPPQVLNSFGSGVGSFRSGLMLTGAGFGIVAAFNAAGEPSIGALGLIPLFIGIAKLLYWMFEERKYDKG